MACKIEPKEELPVAEAIDGDGANMTDIDTKSEGESEAAELDLFS